MVFIAPTVAKLTQPFSDHDTQVETAYSSNSIFFIPDSLKIGHWLLAESETTNVPHGRK